MRVRVTLLLSLLASAISCASSDELIVAFDRLPYSNTPYSFSSGMAKPNNLVIRDAARWMQVWLLLHSNRRPPPPLPAIDFDSSTVVLVAAGEKKSGGYSIEIVGSQIVDSRLRISVKETQPGDRCIVADGITAPVDIAIFPRFDGVIDFDMQLATRDCN